jgi:hypothetical protein
MLPDVAARLNEIPFEFHAPILYGNAVGRHPCPLACKHLFILRSTSLRRLAPG